MSEPYMIDIDDFEFLMNADVMDIEAGEATQGVVLAPGEDITLTLRVHLRGRGRR